jgi:hypothetical protein
MHTNDKTTNHKTNPNDQARDLGQVCAKARKYHGKYPDRIRQVESKDECRAYNVTTNAGAVFEFRVLHRHANAPKPGQDIQEWLLALSPLNELAYNVIIKSEAY